MNDVSIIVPFYGAIDGLRVTLDALRNQTWPRGRMEVLVVDNGAIKTVTSLKEEYPDVCWLHEPKIGSYAARNHGIAHSSGKIIAFTDADCVPDPTWLAEGIAALKNSGATIVGGRIVYLNPLGRNLNIYELIEENFFLLARQQYLIESLRVAATANLFTYKEVFFRVGYFDSELRSFGDGDWTKRATAKGEKLAYSADAVVRHPRRSTLKAITKKWVRVAGGRISQLRRTGGAPFEYITAIINDSWVDKKIHKAVWKVERLTITQRVQIFLVLEFISFRITWTKIAVLLGGKPKRE
jgi:glycosyltransferase involved in cell wall biosynthesis